MPKNKTPESKKDLKADLSLLKTEMWRAPYALLFVLNIIGGYYWVLSLIKHQDLIPHWCDIWSWVSCVPAALFGIRIYLEIKALKTYLYLLERKNIEEAVACGREYYSIKRKGFLGLDGHGYNVEDDDAIINDIEVYSQS